MNDTLRMLLMQVTANAFAVFTALGLFDISAENVGLVTVFINSTLLLVAYFWKAGQQADPATKSE